MTDIEKITLLEQEVSALKVKIEEYNDFFENVQDVLYRTDLSGTVLEISPSIRYFFEFNKKEIIGRSVLSLYNDPSDRKTLLEEITKNGELNDYQLILKTKTGMKHVSINARLIYVKNKPDHIVGSIRDITARKKDELRILEQNKELIDLISEREKFFSIIAHDLRGPLSGLLGLSKLVVDEYIEGVSVEAKEVLVMMRNTIVSTYNLLENLLELSRLQRGLMSFEPESIMLVDIVKEGISSAIDAAQNKKINIDLSEIKKSMIVFADRRMTELVIRNLVSNAIKFTKKDGKIVISASFEENNFIGISISDNGIGMSKSMLKNLFQIDVQTNRKGTEGEPSTGLGLMICKEFIEKHGGKLWVESEEGKGSIFHFTLPKG